MRRHGCPIIAFLIGLPTVGAAYLMIKLPHVWSAILDIITVLLIVLWVLVFGYLVLRAVAWIRRRLEARMPVTPQYGGGQAQGRGEREAGAAGQGVAPSDGGRRIL